MEQAAILQVLNTYYPIKFASLAFMRAAGSRSYTAYAQGHKYFLRLTAPLYFETAQSGVDIHLYLQRQGFPVPPIMMTADTKPYVQLDGEHAGQMLVVYDFVEGEETEPEQDAERIGTLTGKLHRIMKAYPGPLIRRDRYFYIDRYIDILHQKQYPKADVFAAYGAALWERVKDLPHGYCHGDLYTGNTHKAAADSKIYFLDFDTSCMGFPMYDIVLYCNRTHYFEFQEEGYRKSIEILRRFMPAYAKYNSISQKEIDSFCDLLALYHFALQATIIEMLGLNCVDNTFLDRQLDWLCRWQEQCRQKKVMV